jgi:homocysteine S-methyltransferase
VDTRIRDLLGRHTFLTNAGTETYLVFQQGVDLPEFCAFVVHEDEESWAELERNHLDPIFRAAAENRCGLMLDALVWRAQPDFVAKLGRAPEELGPINERAVSRTRASVDRWRRANGHSAETFPVLIAADIGPRGDGYRVENSEVTSDAAREYHRAQIEALAAARVDVVCALTMTTAAESIGIVEAATACELPTIVSPTVETDGRLPDKRPLKSFIEDVDRATEGAPLFYMVNCAHPTHLFPCLEAARATGESWLSRFRGFRANASAKSHGELDNSTELDRGDVQELAEQMATIQAAYGLRVIGGCCGTDHEHLIAMASRSKRQ